MAEDKQKISIKEFKMWLEGVEEMQLEDWTPDARQWRRIREKINLVDDTERPVYATRSNEGGATIPGMEAAFPPFNTNPPTAGNTTAGPSSLNIAPVRPQGPRATATKSGMPVTLATGDSKTPVKTPDVDTSHGNYNSSFE